jgi:LEA14-like dessication related protein
MRRWNAKGIALVAVAVLAGGCIMSFKQPQVRFEGIRLGGLGARGGLVYAELLVLNPNSFRLETTSVSYDLELADPARSGDARWIRLANGQFSEPISVAARDSAVVELPIEFSFEGMSGIARSVLGGGLVDYRVQGVIEVREPMRRNVPYRREGKVSLTGVQ